MSNKRRSGHSHIGAIVATAVTVALASLLFLNRQWVVDQLTVWQYDPAGAITSIADRSGMNAKGRFIFYASRPSIDNAVSFNTACGETHEENTAVLGCYSDRLIYIYNVTNKQLDGIREVTAAHEMLHAAYERLDDGKRAEVNKLVEAEYAKLKTDKRFAERMSFYDRTEPGERDNELHSIIGTEIADISPALEQYYKEYFSDRQKTVTLYSDYSTVFTKLQDRSETIVRQMNSLGKSIEAHTATYNQDVAQLTTDIKSFNNRAEKGSFSSQAQFNNERSALLARAADLDSRRTDIKQDVATYNDLKKELAQIASQSEELNKSIDSTLSPAPNV